MSWSYILPEAILSVTATLLLVVSALANTPAMRDLLRWFSLAALVAAGIALITVGTGAEPTGWSVTTSFSTSFGLVLLALLGWTTLAARIPQNGAGEWFALLLFVALGGLVLSRVGNLPGLFLGIELLSISVYILVAFNYEKKINLKGGVLYLALAGVASSFLILGMALVYADFATIRISEIAAKVAAEPISPLGRIGFLLFLSGMGFKLAVVPFHMWAADVYEAAPSNVAGLIASVSKGATLAALLPFAFLLPTHSSVIVFLCGASMIVGNLLGLRETRVKRILAYSSIAHVGYILLGFLAMGSTVPATVSATVDGASSVVYYVAAYGVSVLGAFACLGALRPEGVVTLNDLRGTARRNPVIAACMLIFTTSMAGLPISVGFWAKLYLFSSAFNAGYATLAVIGLVASAVGLFYYLRIIVYMFMVVPEMTPRGTVEPLPALETAMLVLSAGLVILFSFAPDLLLALIRTAA